MTYCFIFIAKWIFVFDFDFMYVEHLQILWFSLFKIFEKLRVFFLELISIFQFILQGTLIFLYFSILQKTPNLLVFSFVQFRYSSQILFSKENSFHVYFYFKLYSID